MNWGPVQPVLSDVQVLTNGSVPLKHEPSLKLICGIHALNPEAVGMTEPKDGVVWGASVKAILPEQTGGVMKAAISPWAVPPILLARAQ